MAMPTTTATATATATARQHCLTILLTLVGSSAVAEDGEGEEQALAKVRRGEIVDYYVARLLALRFN